MKKQNKKYTDLEKKLFEQNKHLKRELNDLTYMIEILNAYIALLKEKQKPV